MSNSEKTFDLHYARGRANKIIDALIPYCERILTVGSVRRQKQQVHDIEIMFIPSQAIETDLFGMPMPGNAFEHALPGLLETWGAKVLSSGHKKVKLLLPDGLALELHVSAVESWAVEMVIRTGPALFSEKCVTIRQQRGYLPSDCKIKNGWQVFRGEKNIPMVTELDFLNFLGLGWVEPEKRSEHLVAGVSVETVKP